MILASRPLPKPPPMRRGGVVQNALSDPYAAVVIDELLAGRCIGRGRRLRRDAAGQAGDIGRNVLVEILPGSVAEDRYVLHVEIAYPSSGDPQNVPELSTM